MQIKFLLEKSIQLVMGMYLTKLGNFEALELMKIYGILTNWSGIAK